MAVAVGVSLTALVAAVTVVTSVVYTVEVLTAEVAGVAMAVGVSLVVLEVDLLGVPRPPS